MSVRCIVLLVWLSTASWAHAQHVTWNWERGPDALSCASSEELRSRIEQRLGAATFAASSARDTVALTGHIERSHGQWIAAWSMEASGGVLGTRELRSSSRSCRDLDDALVLVATLLLESRPNANAPPLPEPKEPEPPVVVPAASLIKPKAAEPSAAPALPLPAPSPVPRSRPMQYEATGSVAIAGRGLPRTSVGVDVSVTVRPSRFVALELGGAFLPEQRVERTAGSANITAGYVRADLCPGVRLGRVRVEGCLGGEVGAIRASVEETNSLMAAPRRRLQVAGHLAVRAQVAVTQLVFVRAGVYGSRGAGRDRFGIIESSSRFSVLYEVPALTWTVLGGVGFQLR